MIWTPEENLTTLGIRAAALELFCLRLNVSLGPGVNWVDQVSQRSRRLNVRRLVAGARTAGCHFEIAQDLNEVGMVVGAILERWRGIHFEMERNFYPLSWWESMATRTTRLGLRMKWSLAEWTSFQWLFLIILLLGLAGNCASIAAFRSICKAKKPVYLHQVALRFSSLVLLLS